ncbi:unnamed protein product [Taenia asiatica]|uniref:Tetraspanin n=1 Tax=Taenia asiatica TaxID=60517 RepID=A0A0R3VXK3_TAEAS|nr:unnamed protein product [Taenia asiatica]
MGGAIACVFRVLFQILTTFLLLASLLTAVGGIMMKASTHVLQSIVAMAINGYISDAGDIRQMAAFLIEVVDSVATCSITVGFVLTVLCLIGLIASCSGWNKVLKIYAGILFVLLVVQIIAVAVVFANPTNFTDKIANSTKALLKSYGDTSEEGNRSTVIWDLLMETAPICCGMDGYEDFVELGKDLPIPCCDITIGDCNATAAASAGVKGCRSKVEVIATIKYAIFLNVCIAVLFMQALLVVLVTNLICAAKKEEKGDVGSESL